MKTLRLVAATALVSSVFALSAAAAEREWWNIDFESPTPNDKYLVVAGAESGSLDVLTNSTVSGRPYTNGIWTAIDSDESYVTNSFNPTNSFGGDYCLRLDTQGNDLTWTPKDPTNGVQTLVDADLYLVGSDSEPTDFDANSDVQAAIYLMNQVDADTQETTNSLLCVYVYDENLESNVWVTLDGVEVENESWAHIQVKVDHAAAKPMVSVKIGDTQLHAFGDATATNWPAANQTTAKAAGKISSVAFRGTGAVDNFVGKTVVEEEAFCTLTVETWVGNTQNGTAAAKNPTLVATDVPIGSPYTFTGLAIDDYEEGVEASYSLSRIVIYNADGTVLETINYSEYDGDDISITPDKDDSAYFAWGLDENDDRDGTFKLTVPTTGIADGDDLVIAKVYYTLFNQPQVVVDPVDPGDSMSAVEKAQYVPAGVVTETDDQTGVTTTSFVVHFKGVAGVTYELLSSTTLTLTEAEWKAATVEDTVVCTSANEDDVLELKVELDPNDTAKFFKIGASATQP